MKPSSLRTSAIRILRRDFGTRHFSCRAEDAFRMRVSMSPMGSVMESLLPARLDDADDLALQRALAEAESAHLELAKERARAAAQRASVVLADRELQLALGLRHLGKLRHRPLLVTGGTACRGGGGALGLPRRSGRWSPP